MGESRVLADITMSLDGFIAGPNDGRRHTANAAKELVDPRDSPGKPSRVLQERADSATIVLPVRGPIKRGGIPELCGFFRRIGVRRQVRSVLFQISVEILGDPRRSGECRVL